jgi:hypothetical protein
MDYLNHHSREKEKLERLQLVALKFKMFRELAKVKEKQALKDLKKIKPKILGKDVFSIYRLLYLCCNSISSSFGGGRDREPPLPSLPLSALDFHRITSCYYTKLKHLLRLLKFS